MVSIIIRSGTGHRCRICNKSITKLQKQISFKGLDFSAIIHSDSMDCDRRKRLSKQIGGC